MHSPLRSLIGKTAALIKTNLEPEVNTEFKCVITPAYFEASNQRRPPFRNSLIHKREGMRYTYIFQFHLIEKPRSEIYLHVICIYHFAEKLDSVKWSRRVLMNPGWTSPNGEAGTSSARQPFGITTAEAILLIGLDWSSRNFGYG